MEAQTPQQVYDEIKGHIVKQGSAYSTWYCGITSDWESRLFDQHKIPQEDYWFIVRQCHNDDDARNVEEALLKLGCDGAPGGGDQNTVYVYAYLKGNLTSP